ncbi:MAG: rhomboid family intramembrane serine protease [Oscillospiraceae bacterium]|nr:rhomboid family intramembrane serine protease [Oscillospiraceae bacterium]MBQ3880740.1 rhomboid family intramembrane serine protease [Oscillospiraceae bacterium]
MLKKIQYNSPVCLTFSLVTLIILAANLLTHGLLNSYFFSVYFTSFSDPMLYVRLFTHVLGHASWAHYFSNIVYILLLGPMLEEKYGSKALLGGMAVTAVATGAAHLIFAGQTALLGASGIVFMMILLASFASFSQGHIPLTFLLIAAIYLGNEIATGLTSADNISQLSHIIGGLAGAVMGFVFKKNGKKRRKK